MTLFLVGMNEQRQQDSYRQLATNLPVFAKNIFFQIPLYTSG